MDVMIDLETLGSSSNSIILTIGAIKFNREECPGDLKDMDTFYCRVNIPTQKQLGLEEDKSTIEWWDKQDSKVKNEAFKDKKRIELKDALEKFNKWFDGSQFIWGNGSSFDCSIMENAYRKTKVDVPWKFWNVRDVRTIFDLGNVKSYQLPQMSKHHALVDCYRQIIGVYYSLYNLKYKINT